jgi:transcriptional regulator with XRE-family HTH domain
MSLTHPIDMSTKQQLVQTSERLRKILKKLDLTQVELAIKIGIHPGSIGNYLYGNRMPGALSCLLLAGLCSQWPEDSTFFREAAGLEQHQIELLQLGLAGSRTRRQKKPGA